MNKNYNPKLQSNARLLRRNMTKEERHLWYDCLKHLLVTVHRQKVIGNYIVDFYIAELKLIIELDGSQHYAPDHQAQDQERDHYLQEQGFSVLRIPNNEINRNFDGVCEELFSRVQRMKGNTGV